MNTLSQMLFEEKRRKQELSRDLGLQQTNSNDINYSVEIDEVWVAYIKLLS